MWLILIRIKTSVICIHIIFTPLFQTHILQGKSSSYIYNKE